MTASEVSVEDHVPLVVGRIDLPHLQAAEPLAFQSATLCCMFDYCTPVYILFQLSLQNYLITILSM